MLTAALFPSSVRSPLTVEPHTSFLNWPETSGTFAMYPLPFIMAPVIISRYFGRYFRNKGFRFAGRFVIGLDGSRSEREVVSRKCPSRHICVAGTVHGEAQDIIKKTAA